MRRPIGWWSAAVLSVLVALYALGLYGFGPGIRSEQLHPDMRAAFSEQRWVIHTHIFAAMLALLLGPWQFSARLRAARPGLHRWLGRVYLGVGVGVGGVAGLLAAWNAFGGPVARAGFTGLALAWLYTGARAYGAARTRDFAAHRRWMVRNFALSFAAVTLRLYLPWVFVFGWPFAACYAAIAWLCWVPNLLVAERLLRRG